MTVHPTQMVSLYNDPQGNNIFDKADAAVARCSTNSTPDNEDSLKETIDSLRRRITELESELLHKDVQL